MLQGRSAERVARHPSGVLRGVRPAPVPRMAAIGQGRRSAEVPTVAPWGWFVSDYDRGVSVG